MSQETSTISNVDVCTDCGKFRHEHSGYLLCTTRGWFRVEQVAEQEGWRLTLGSNEVTYIPFRCGTSFATTLVIRLNQALREAIARERDSLRVENAALKAGKDGQQ